MSNGFDSFFKLQRDMLRAGQAHLALHKQAIDASEQALAAHKLVNTQSSAGLKMWQDWLDLWTPGT